MCRTYVVQDRGRAKFIAGFAVHFESWKIVAKCFFVILQIEVGHPCLVEDSRLEGAVRQRLADLKRFLKIAESFIRTSPNPIDIPNLTERSRLSLFVSNSLLHGEREEQA